jgi:hypothetical protein
MPDSPPIPDAKSPQPEVDELAKGLPGLPLEIDKVRVSDEGFLKRDKHAKPVARIGWAEVTAVEDRSKSIKVLAGAASPARVIFFRTKREDGTRVTDAWREYLARRIDRDGALTGVCALDQVTREIVTGLCGMGVYTVLPAYVILRRFAQSGTGDTLVMVATLAPLVLASLYTLIFLFDRLRRRSALIAEWRKWKLCGEGMVHWPEESERTLALRPDDSADVEGATVAGVRIRFIDLRYGFLVREIILAMAERNGAECKASPGPRASWLLSGLVLIASFASLWYVMANTRGWEAAVRAIWVVACFAVFGVVAMAMAMWYLHRVVFRDSLARGRAMLERLGW